MQTNLLNEVKVKVKILNALCRGFRKGENIWPQSRLEIRFNRLWSAKTFCHQHLHKEISVYVEILFLDIFPHSFIYFMPIDRVHYWWIQKDMIYGDVRGGKGGGWSSYIHMDVHNIFFLLVIWINITRICAHPLAEAHWSKLICLRTTLRPRVSFH